MKKIIIFAVIILLILAIVFLGYFGYKYFSFEKKAKEVKEVDLSLSRVKERGKLIVGTNLPFEPIVYYNKEGEIVGLDADLIKAIASKMGVSLEMQDVPWDGLFNDLKAEKFDVVIDGITITAERQAEMLFSVPYLNAGQVVVVRSENDNISKLEDLAGKKIGVLKDTTCEEAALKYADSSLIQKYESQDVVTQSLKEKKVDAMVVDYIVAMDVIKNNSDLKVATSQFTEEYYGIAARMSDRALMEEINNILREMRKTKELDNIILKWLNK